MEDWNDESGQVMWQNSPEGKHAEKFKRQYREVLEIGARVRISKSENLCNKP